jgi:hypothetical protein
LPHRKLMPDPTSVWAKAIEKLPPVKWGGIVLGGIFFIPFALKLDPEINPWLWLGIVVFLLGLGHISASSLSVCSRKVYSWVSKRKVRREILEKFIELSVEQKKRVRWAYRRNNGFQLNEANEDVRRIEEQGVFVRSGVISSGGRHYDLNEELRQVFVMNQSLVEENRE